MGSNHQICDSKSHVLIISPYPYNLAGKVGVEPTTRELTAPCSTTELHASTTGTPSRSRTYKISGSKPESYANSDIEVLYLWGERGN